MKDNTPSALIQLNAIEVALVEAKTIAEIKDIRNQAEAARQCFRLAEYGLEMQNDAAEVKLRAERRAGKFLADIERISGKRSDLTSSNMEEVKPTYTATLQENNLSWGAASRWQLEAEVPSETFEQHIAEVKAKNKELTSMGLVRLAKKLRLEKEQQETADNVLSFESADRCYKTIVIDPPWPTQKIIREARPNQDRFSYRTMTIDEIAKLPLGDLASEDGCHVYLWTTHKYLPSAFDLFAQWGVKYQCLMTWVKPTGMTPYSWMYNTELVLFGRLGSLKLERMGLKLSFNAPVTKHSEKPDVFYERVRLASPSPRLDIFARRQREGFQVWGDEV